MSKFEFFRKARASRINLPEAYMSPIPSPRPRDMRLSEIIELVNREMARLSGEAQPEPVLARA